MTTSNQPPTTGAVLGAAIRETGSGRGEHAPGSVQEFDAMFGVDDTSTRPVGRLTASETGELTRTAVQAITDLRRASKGLAEAERHAARVVQAIADDTRLFGGDAATFEARLAEAVRAEERARRPIPAARPKPAAEAKRATKRRTVVITEPGRAERVGSNARGA